ncbi:cell envelope-related function transcriptional attenuator common domain-containing protein [Nonomuraea solani]|uniref:Cell envelope-related function transcriptional attenuator common domain-containing protein n=1 Tax=Nonomuraea solani TaxID=1144553 RepID=A0A1H5YWS5_9ACTN|nr:LCP family protein [Nonomuraea solani]SEG28484.1 cell envelope-related function transcriptional attenuator common domain-containing protein [Nonomuraea solani]
MRQPREPVSAGAVLGWLVLAALAPGAAHLRAGWRKTGLVLLSLYAAALLALLAVYLVTETDNLLGSLTDNFWLTVVIIGAGVLGLAWFALIVHSFVVLRPGRLPQSGQILTGTLAGLLAVVVVIPFGFVGQFAYTSQSTLNGIFAQDPADDSPTAAQPKPEDPWAGRDRVNILLLGGDADDHRTGVRTDSMNLASIDVKTGGTVLFSLPRNLEDVRFRPGTPMAKRFPTGFRLPPDPGGGRSDLLNSVWEYADAHPEIFGGKQKQGPKVLMDTIGYTLGVKVDWYALVNMWGFARLIDAIGGVTLTVEQDVVFGRYNEGLVKAGTRKLKGADAMWYARSRTYSDDYTRMRRQRCVLGAILDQADPATVLTRFNQIALATKELIRTDIPRPMLRHLVPLALKVKNAKVASVQFVPPLINTGYPDWDKIRDVAAKAIRDSAGKTVAATASPASPSPTKSPKKKKQETDDPTKGLTDGCGAL